MNSYLFQVQRPARYLGNEIHAVRDPCPGDLRVGLAFPDLYEIGMSNLGISILYHILNSIPGIFAERIFTPDIDLEYILRDRHVPLTTLETHTPLRSLNIVGFSLHYELVYTNILTMLDLGGIPLHSSERTSTDPLILGGGPCAFNPEPVSDFIDAFVIGDGEYRLPEICCLYREWKATGNPREELLRSLDRMEGVYVPSLFNVERCSSQGKEHLIPLGPRKGPVRKCVVSDLDSAPFPDHPIVPFLKVVHDRINMEVARGCPHGCRFCQAGVIYRPYRERSPQRIYDSVIKSLRHTGHEEVSLLSLSIGDYSGLPMLVERLMNHLSKQRIALSLPSIRVGSLDTRIVHQILRVRKTGFTLAPEAATDRLQNVINKKIDEEELVLTTLNLVKAGWRHVKLYFMIGLPTETEQDVEGIIALANQVRRTAHRHGTGFQIAVNVSTFVPKAHTPFQWVCQISRTEAEEKQAFLRDQLWQRASFRLKWHDSRLSMLEGVFARGDRHLGRVIEQAYRLGCRLDGWSEYFRFDVWQKAFETAGVDPDQYVHRQIAPADPLPWDWIDTGVRKEFLVNEYKKALQGVSTPLHCAGDCEACGICVSWKLPKHDNTLPDVTQHEPESPRVVHPRPVLDQKRIRFRYSKKPPAIFLGHLETMAVFHRAFRRTKLPLTYTIGLHPHLRISFSQALALGIESTHEFLDVVFDNDLDSRYVAAALNDQLPEGFQILDADAVPLNALSLEENIEEVHYRIVFHEAPDKGGLLKALFHAIELFQSGKSSIIDVSKKQRHTCMDLRPHVRKLVASDDSCVQLLVVICRSSGSLISISRVLDSLFHKDIERTWPYSIGKTDTKFRPHETFSMMDNGHGE